MSNYLFDTNVLIDFLADRRPFSLEAAMLFNSSVNGKVKLYISAVSYNNIYYILRQKFSQPKTIKLLEDLSDLTEIIDVSKDVIKKSIKSDFKDFEDAIQYHCALSFSKIDFVVTRDTKDLKKSNLPILTPKEANSMVESTRK